MTDTMTILLAESQSIDAAYMSHLLERNGWRTEIAKDGQEVLEKIQEKQYTLILMNGQLPQLDGLETTRRIRQSEKQTKTHIPIVGVTRYSLEGEKKKLLNAGMDYCLSQPIYKQALFEVLDLIKKASKSNISVA